MHPSAPTHLPVRRLPSTYRMSGNVDQSMVICGIVEPDSSAWSCRCPWQAQVDDDSAQENDGGDGFDVFRMRSSGAGVDNGNEGRYYCWIDRSFPRTLSVFDLWRVSYLYIGMFSVVIVLILLILFFHFSSYIRCRLSAMLTTIQP